ncbi:MAG: phosphomannomutase/phosphoglucomutase [Planctomycetota bacterium]
MLGRVFKAYDIRGTYPDLLTDQMAWQIGYGASRFLLQDAEQAGETTPMMKNVVVGRDMRASSPGLSGRLIKGITDHGGDVIDIGLCDTPMVYFAINYLDCAGGIQVTASHNPPQYNGFKISKRKAKPVGEPTGLGDIRKYAAMVDRGVQDQEGTNGRSEVRDLWDAYRQHVRAFLDTSALGAAGSTLKVVIDASNAMAGTMVPKVFGRNGSGIDGVEIIELNFENSKGEFAHEPNPLVAANLRQLQDAVAEHSADFGICFDGDADRLMVVDEKSQIVGCDHLTTLLAKFFLQDNPGSPIVYDLRSSKALAEDVVAAGGKPVQGRVGHVFMKQAMTEHQAVFGGELSGHFYFRDNFNADSGAIAMAVVLTVLSRAKADGQALSDLVAPISRYAQSGEVNFETEDKDEAINAFQEEFGPGSDFDGDIEELDGCTIDCWDRPGEHGGWWANVRKSNTEPLLRLNVEAKDAATLERIVEEIAPFLGTRVDH